MAKILFIVGSLHKDGFNKQLADEAKALIGDRAEVEFLDYTNVPFFSQDIEYPAPDSVSSSER